MSVSYRTLPDLRQLAAFAAVAECGSFRAAAARLRVSQPALTLRIAALEDRLGLRLLERGRAGAVTTSAGAALLPQARRALEAAAELPAQAARIGAGKAGELRIGATVLGLLGPVPGVLAAVRAGLPGVHLVLRELASGPLEAALAAHELDVAILHPPVALPGLALDTLKADSFVAALPRGHALARRRRLRLADLAGVDMVMVARPVGPVLHDRIVAACRQTGFSPVIAAEVATSVSVLGLVAARAGVGLVARSLAASLARADVVYRPLEAPGLDLPFALAHLAARPPLLVRPVRDLVCRAWPLE